MSNPGDFFNEQLKRSRELSAEFNSQMEIQAQGKVIIDASLPVARGERVRKLMIVTKETNTFLTVASVVNDFLPREGDASGAQKAYSAYFQRAFIASDDSECVYIALVGEALYGCRYDKRAHRAAPKSWRNPQAFKKCVLAEAVKLQKLKDWRKEKPQLAFQFAEAFYALSSLIYWQPRGQVLSTDPNRKLVEELVELVSMEPGGDKIANALLTPGSKFGGPDGKGVPSPGRAMLFQAMRARCKELAKGGITEGGVKRALHAMDRRRKPKDQN